mmetsp:Transcript_6518/g.18314  ORF Transcript_6518/g.18314 Transcript_6518/m.18314 type:complete len:554 (+) Transcript_6518:655-2316(+)
MTRSTRSADNESTSSGGTVYARAVQKLRAQIEAEVTCGKLVELNNISEDDYQSLLDSPISYSFFQLGLFKDVAGLTSDEKARAFVEEPSLMPDGDVAPDTSMTDAPTKNYDDLNKRESFIVYQFAAIIEMLGQNDIYDDIMAEFMTLKASSYVDRVVCGGSYVEPAIIQSAIQVFLTVGYCQTRMHEFEGQPMTENTLKEIPRAYFKHAYANIGVHDSKCSLYYDKIGTSVSLPKLPYDIKDWYKWKERSLAILAKLGYAMVVKNRFMCMQYPAINRVVYAMLQEALADMHTTVAQFLLGNTVKRAGATIGEVGPYINSWGAWNALCRSFEKDTKHLSLVHHIERELRGLSPANTHSLQAFNNGFKARINTLKTLQKLNKDSATDVYTYYCQNERFILQSYYDQLSKGNTLIRNVCKMCRENKVKDLDEAIDLVNQHYQHALRRKDQGKLPDTDHESDSDETHESIRRSPPKKRKRSPKAPKKPNSEKKGDEGDGNSRSEGKKRKRHNNKQRKPNGKGKDDADKKPAQRRTGSGEGHGNAIVETDSDLGSFTS